MLTLTSPRYRGKGMTWLVSTNKTVDTEASAEILFILAPPRSFTTVVSAIIGQHPQMYGLPELQLFIAKTMAEWLDLCSHATYGMDHGLVRVVAELYFGGQTEYTAKLARGWVRHRSHLSTSMMIEQLATKVEPMILVDKSPNIVYRVKSLRWAHRMFPRAKFIHLLRHPKGHGESVIKYLKYVRAQRGRLKLGPLPSSHWLLHLASYPYQSVNEKRTSQKSSELDPQGSWYALNLNICKFLESVPDEQKLQIRSEDLLNDLSRGLGRIAGWMGLRTDAEALDEMTHPERSPYACYGPPGARFGNDRLFLEKPTLRPERAKRYSLDGPLSWRKDGRGLLAEVVQLAREFGYK